MGIKIQTIKDIRDYLASELNGYFIKEEIRALSDIIIRHATHINKLSQLYDNEYRITGDAARKIQQYVSELKTGKPVQYILGETTFYNCKIKVNGSTLIPRPETEELVNMIIKENKEYSGRIVDIGTGSGCIAIAIALNLPFSKVIGIDISDDALKTASENAQLNNAKAEFIKCDILKSDYGIIGKAGIIVSNPPYVRNSEKVLMAKNVLDFEPHSALFVDDSDPLLYYKAILNMAEHTLLPEGRIYFEINEAMGIPLKRLIESYGYSEIKLIRDINNKDRIIKCMKNG